MSASLQGYWRIFQLWTHPGRRSLWPLLSWRVSVKYYWSRSTPNLGLVCPYFLWVLFFFCFSPTITVGLWLIPQSNLARFIDTNPILNFLVHGKVIIWFIVRSLPATYSCFTKRTFLRADQRVKLTLVDAAIGSDCDEEVIVVRKPILEKKV